MIIVKFPKKLNHRLLAPTQQHERTYWVQVEGMINDAAMHELKQGVVISIDGKPYNTLPCKASLFKEPPSVPERTPPIRFRKDIPVSWISLSLVEGKNRQVRRMTAKVGFPTLRLIRYQIANKNLAGMQPGEMKELSKKEMYDQLFA